MNLKEKLLVIVLCIVGFIVWIILSYILIYALMAGTKLLFGNFHTSAEKIVLLERVLTPEQRKQYDKLLQE